MHSIWDGENIVILTDSVRAITRSAILLDENGPHWASGKWWIPKSRILDADIEETGEGDEVTIEILGWKAVELGLVE